MMILHIALISQSCRTCEKCIKPETKVVTERVIEYMSTPKCQTLYNEENKELTLDVFKNEIDDIVLDVEKFKSVTKKENGKTVVYYMVHEDNLFEFIIAFEKSKLISKSLLEERQKRCMMIDEYNNGANTNGQ